MKVSFVVVALCALFACVLAQEQERQYFFDAAGNPLVDVKAAFHEFTQKFGKTYESAQERDSRFAIFQDNLKHIDELNNRGTHATFGITKFADLTREEFKAKYLSKSYPTSHPVDAPVAPLVSDEVVAAIPTNWDWRSKGAVTDVKDQGQCGSCWSFSTTGNVEGQWFLAGHPLVGLSEQNLVDCDHECMQYDGQKACDDGCNGGLMPNAFHYIIKTGGIDTESSYPYEGENMRCRFKNSTVGAHISNYTMVSKDETQMAAFLYQHGPIAIAADAEMWQFYYFGVFEGPCGTTLDHGILIVGYGQETDYLGMQINYWIVKNSWGADWGLDGYLKIIRGVGECGLNLFACSAIV